MPDRYPQGDLTLLPSWVPHSTQRSRDRKISHLYLLSLQLLYCKYCCSVQKAFPCPSLLPPPCHCFSSGHFISQQQPLSVLPFLSLPTVAFLEPTADCHSPASNIPTLHTTPPRPRAEV